MIMVATDVVTGAFAATVDIVVHAVVTGAHIFVFFINLIASGVR